MHRQLTELVPLLEEQASMAPTQEPRSGRQDDPPTRSGGEGQAAEALQAELRALLTRLGFESTTDAAWESVDGLEALLPRLGDRAFVGSLLALEWGLENRADWLHPWGHYGWGRVRWTDYFTRPELRRMYVAHGGRLEDDSPGEVDPGPTSTAQLPDHSPDPLAVERLVALYRMRSQEGRRRRARFDTRSKYFGRALFLLLPLGAALWWALSGLLDVPSREIASAAIAGAVGATLSGFYVLRKLTRLTEFRLFRAGMKLQPVVGALAAMVLLLILTSDVVSLARGSDRVADLAAYGFLAGFSEPYFLGVIGKIAGAGTEQSDRRSA